MKTFGSCHLTINRSAPMDLRLICDFIYRRWLLRWGGISTPFMKCTPFTYASISSRYFARFGKPLNISPAKISTFNLFHSPLTHFHFHLNTLILRCLYFISWGQRFNHTLKLCFLTFTDRELFLSDNFPWEYYQFICMISCCYFEQ